MVRIKIWLLVVVFFSITCSRSSTTASAIKLNPTLQNKLEQVRKLSRESGLSQVELADEDVCLDEGCLDAAYDILMAMNASVDPCQDFYQFSIREILTEDQNDQDAKPVNQLKSFYKSCLDLEAIEEDGLAPMQELISEFGGWQMLSPTTWNSSFDWLHVIAEMKRRTRSSALISVLLRTDIKNSSRFLVYLDQPDFTLDHKFMIAPEVYTTMFTAYEQYVVDVAQILGTAQTEVELRASAKSFIGFEVELAKIASTDIERYDNGRLYNPFLLNEYQSITDEIDSSFSIPWKKYLDQLFSTSGVTISDDEPIVVMEVDYNKDLIPILARTDPVTVANYIIWRLVSDVADHSNAAIRDAAFKFSQAQTGATQPTPRNATCSNAASSVFGTAIGMKYIETEFDHESIAEVENILHTLHFVFKNMIRDADWIQDETEVEAIAKVNAIKSQIGYPEWLENKTIVEGLFEGLKLTDTHFGNQLSLNTYKMNSSMKTLHVLPDRNEWYFKPTDVNAAYSPGKNSINFPAGYLQPPFFGKPRPKYVNYGAIGMSLGHETTHGFDTIGSEYDKDGNPVNWWDNVTRAEFYKRAQCMADQYSAYYVPDAGLYLNGTQTLSENIADNGALRESYRAYLKYVEDNGPEKRLPGLEGFSPNQLFFVGFGNIFCESSTRQGLINTILTDIHSPYEYHYSSLLT